MDSLAVCLHKSTEKIHTYIDLWKIEVDDPSAERESHLDAIQCKGYILLFFSSSYHDLCGNSFVALSLPAL